MWRERRRLLAQLPSHLLHAYAGAAGGSLHHYARAHALVAAPACSLSSRRARATFSTHSALRSMCVGALSVRAASIVAAL